MKEQKQGQVISRYGNRAEIEADDGCTIRCHIRRALQDLVCGDFVQWQIDQSSDEGQVGVITAILERETVLSRPIRYQGVKPVAANIDLIMIVTAKEPHFSERILDRYLVAVEDSGIDALVVLNKIDLLTENDPIYETMASYKALGYPLIEVSSKTAHGLDALKDSLHGRNSIFVGQSGVGKSSLVNLLLPETDSTVSALSETSGLGTHTTTASRLYHLPAGGNLIDSPGIREFGMDHLEPQAIMQGFVEIAELSQFCKFRNCQHLNEPSCAVKAALKNQQLSQKRYTSYKMLLQEALQD